MKLRLVRRAGLLVFLALAVGCKGGQGTVSGTVYLNDKPLPGGLVTFRPADSSKNVVSARIGDDGHFEATLPAGEVRIAVDNREFQPPPRGEVPKLPPVVDLPPGVKPPQHERQGSPAAPEGGPEKPSGKYVPIPPQYYDVDTSDLKLVVQPGPQSYDFRLK
jgi:hypothetical protein